MDRGDRLHDDHRGSGEGRTAERSGAEGAWAEGAGGPGPEGPSDAGKLMRSERWSGLRPGDAVRVSGTRLRSATWAFVAHVHNRRTGEEWVEVVGGRPGDRKVRSFPPARIYPPAARPSASPSGPSFAEAPQLPLG